MAEEIPLLEFKLTKGEQLGFDGFVPIDGSSLMERALAVDFRYMAISWERAGILRLPVEDDICFLCDAHNELPELYTDGGLQHVYLGDGELELSVTVALNEATIAQRYVPFLDRRFATSIDYRVTIEQYVTAWRLLLLGIVEVVAKLELSRSGVDPGTRD